MAFTLIDFNETSRQAFERGLAKGLAAPLLLHAANRGYLVRLPEVAIPQVTPVRPSKALLEMSDLARLGLNVNAAVDRYEQEIG